MVLMMPMSAAVVVIVVVAISVLRHIDLLVPTFLNKVDRCTAGAVTTAILVPVLDVLGRRVQIHGLSTVDGRSGDDGLAVDQLWWRVAADIECAVEARLADADSKVVGVTVE